MIKLRPIPTADQPWFGPDGKPRVYEYLFDLDKALRAALSLPIGVPASRKIQAGDGLTGGGDLSADRIISVLFGTIGGTVAAGNDSRIVGAAQASSLGSAAYASTGDFDASGAASSAIATHVAASDPHPQYLTASEGNATYQPLDSDLTAIASLATTSYGRALLTLANGAALKALLTINAADIADASANGRSFITAANYAAMKSLLSLVKADVGLGNVDNISVASAWTSYTPTIAASSGAFTSVSSSGAYLQLGKTVFVRIQVSITTNGTAAGAVTASLPATAKSGTYQSLFGSESALTAIPLQGICSGSSVIIRKLDTTYPGANGYVLNVSGVYEAA